MNMPYVVLYPYTYIYIHLGAGYFQVFSTVARQPSDAHDTAAALGNSTSDTAGQYARHNGLVLHAPAAVPRRRTREQGAGGLTKQNGANLFHEWPREKILNGAEIQNRCGVE